jgi:ATP-dependent Clp protease ATP-binding subunit ClpA
MWTPATNKEISYRIVYNQNGAQTAPGIYRRERHSAAEGGVIETQVLQAPLTEIPLDPYIESIGESHPSPYILSRLDYALVTTNKKDVYTINERGLQRLNSEPVENISILFMGHSTHRTYDLIYLSDLQKKNGELFVIRDDGASYSLGQASITEDEHLKLGRQTFSTPEEIINLVNYAVASSPVLSDEGTKRAPGLPKTTRASTPALPQPSQTTWTIPNMKPPTSSGGQPPANEAKAESSSDEFLSDLEDVEVAGPDGKKTTAKRILKSFVTDIAADLRAHENTSIATDQDLEMKIARGLLKLERGSVAFLGEAGTGKSTQIRGLVHDIQIAKKPELEALRKYTFLEVSPAALGAGNGVVGAMEAKVAALIAISKANNIIWVFDEMHVLRGLGTSSHDSNDVLDFMMKPLSDGTLRAIGITTPDSFWAMFGGDPALRRRFTVIERKEVSPEEALKISQSWIKHHSLPEAPESVLKETVRLAKEMDPSRAQPDATITLLEEAYADKNLSPSARTAPLTMAEVHEAAVRLYNMDPSFISPSRQIERLAKLKNDLNENIIGQDLAKETVFRLTEQVLADVHDVSRPRIMAVLTGKKGLGKTEFVVAYAKALGLPLEIIEMNSFASARSSFDRMGLMEAIANAINKSPFVVIAFDEFEKAPIEVQNELLRMLNNGEFSVTVKNKGSNGSSLSRKIDARKASIFFTANAGQDFMRSNNKPSIGFVSNHDTETDSKRERELRQALESDNLSNVVLDRVNAIIPFISTSRDEFKRVIALHLKKTLSEISERKKITLSVVNEEAFLEHAAEKLYHADVSNRDALRAIQSEVRQTLAGALIGQENVGHLTLKFEGSHFATQTGANKPGENCGALLK